MILKKLACGVLVVVILVTFAACGSTDPVVGDWKLSSMEMMGMSISADDLAEIGMDGSVIQLQMTKDGKFSLTMIDMMTGSDSETYEGTWKKSNGAYALDIDGEVQEATLSDDNKFLTLEDSGVKIIFTK